MSSRPTVEPHPRSFLAFAARVLEEFDNLDAIQRRGELHELACSPLAMGRYQAYYQGVRSDWFEALTDTVRRELALWVPRRALRSEEGQAFIERNAKLLNSAIERSRPNSQTARSEPGENHRRFPRAAIAQLISGAFLTLPDGARSRPAAAMLLNRGLPPGHHGVMGHHVRNAVDTLGWQIVRIDDEMRLPFLSALMLRFVITDGLWLRAVAECGRSIDEPMVSSLFADGRMIDWRAELERDHIMPGLSAEAIGAVIERTVRGLEKLRCSHAPTRPAPVRS